MNLPANQYFALIVPVCAALQGLAFIGCWAAMRKHTYLLWVGASYILSAIPLAIHSLMATSELADWAIPAGAMYLLGIWFAARGMAVKYGGTAYPRIAFSILGVTLALLYYFAEVRDHLWIRMLILNFSILLLLALPLKTMFQHDHSPVLFERILRISYALLVTYAFIRTMVVLVWIPMEINWEVTRSGYWLLMLAMNLIISMWFTFVLLACVMRELFVTLNNERNQDPLTRLLNRRAFFEQADRQLQINTGGVWALIACDVDHFKKVNDTWGHAAGDQALALVAETLMQQVRQNDLVARFGGEEFVILLKCQDIQSAKMVADRMCVQIARTHFPAISGSLTASFGVTLIASSQSLLVAIENADAMLYQAKRAGRNQVAHEIEAIES